MRSEFCVRRKRKYRLASERERERGEKEKKRKKRKAENWRVMPPMQALEKATNLLSCPPTAFQMHHIKACPKFLRPKRKGNFFSFSNNRFPFIPLSLFLDPRVFRITHAWLHRNRERSVLCEAASGIFFRVRGHPVRSRTKNKWGEQAGMRIKLVLLWEKVLHYLSLSLSLSLSRMIADPACFLCAHVKERSKHKSRFFFLSLPQKKGRKNERAFSTPEPDALVCSLARPGTP